MNPDDLTQEVKNRYKKLIDEGLTLMSGPTRGAPSIIGADSKQSICNDEVINQDKCVGCAACVTICPVDVFDFVDEKPVDTRHTACVYCELCVDVCPVLRPTDNDLGEQIGLLEPKLDSGFGPYGYGCYARATDKAILEAGQGVFVRLYYYMACKTVHSRA